MRKAAEDEFALRKLLPDPDSPDAIIGFHAQQALEKIVKAVLASASVRHQRTHNLGRLIDVARKKGLDFPKELEDITRLTPFAVGFRYDAPRKSLDREWVSDRIKGTRAWAEGILSGSSTA